MTVTTDRKVNVFVDGLRRGWFLVLGELEVHVWDKKSKVVFVVAVRV